MVGIWKGRTSARTTARSSEECAKRPVRSLGDSDTCVLDVQLVVQNSRGKSPQNLNP